ncbi:MAG: poly-gamma-glutamate capsule biosynthesis protein CapA/YwtB (metallophosphatase superfamily) [Verrucomicrobiales bacterium]|jgi:poly-gamma-glutamate capsule biosynthesis protein CapA/YwtB (metallophosphatase superfamily)
MSKTGQTGIVRQPRVADFPTYGLLVFLGVLSLLAAACSSPSTSVTRPEGARLIPSDPVSADDLHRQVAEPSVGRASGEPSPREPIIHVIGSVRSAPDVVTDWHLGVPLTIDDVGTVANLGCAPSTGCEPNAVAAWAKGQLQLMNVATRAAAIDGPVTLADQVLALENAGVLTIGYGQTIESAVAPVFLRADGFTIALHAISLADDPNAMATATSAGIAGPTALDALREAVIASRDSGYGVVVLVDWDRPDSRAPNDEELADVGPLVDLGVDAIVGHGSNFLQRFDQVGKTVVAYSLGNGITTDDNPLFSDTAVLRLEFNTPGRSCLIPATASGAGPALDDPRVIRCG